MRLLLLCVGIAVAQECASDVAAYVSKLETNFLSAAAEAANYLPIGRCDCVLDNSTKETPLHRVINLASHGQIAAGPFTVVVEALLAKHADLGLADSSGATPLHLAAFHGEAIACSVLSWAATRSSSGWRLFNIQDMHMFTPLARALHGWQVPCARAYALSNAPAANASATLGECGPSLVEAVLRSDQALLTQALQDLPFGVDCVVPPNPGRNGTLLHLASELVEEENGVEVLQRLLDAGADPVRQDFEGNSPLYGAVRADSAEAVSAMLAAAGEDLLSQQNRRGQTLLHVAAMEGAINCLRLLVVEGADTAAQDFSGRTVLDYANERGNVEALESIRTGSALAAANEAQEQGGGGSGFQSSAGWTVEDEAAADAAENDPGAVSTEIIAACIVGAACGGLCLAFCIFLLRRRSRRKRTVANHEEPRAVKAKKVWVERTAEPAEHSRAGSRSGRHSEDGENEVHEIPGTPKRPSVVVHAASRAKDETGDLMIPCNPSQATTSTRPSTDSPEGEKKGRGPRSAGKADPSPSAPSAKRVKVKAKGKVKQTPTGLS